MSDASPKHELIFCPDTVKADVTETVRNIMEKQVLVLLRPKYSHWFYLDGFSFTQI